MPQLRKDPIIGRWVIIATERAKRPGDFGITPQKDESAKECPFCEGREHNTPKEIYAIRKHNTQPNTSGWDVRVVPSVSPILKIEGNVMNRHGVGVYDVVDGIGAHEIIIESPQHIANISELGVEHINKIINTYIARIKDLGNDKRLKYVLVFKNFGLEAGGGDINHTRSQIIATPINPKRVKEELVGARRYFEFKERCIFCDMIKQELKDGIRVVAEIDGFVVLSPFASRFPFEVWILPKRHSCDFYHIQEDEIKKLANVLKTVLSKLSKALNDPPYNYVIHTAPFRNITKTGYWRSIDQDYHWHIEITPRLTHVAGFEWGTGFYINPTPPEDAAKFLREVKDA